MCAYSCLVLSLLELWLSHGDVGLGQEIPMWKAVALLRIPLAGRPALTGQSGICRKEETGQLMHLVIPLIRQLSKAWREKEKKRKRVTENEIPFFPREELGLSIPGIATGLQTIHTLSCVCWESEWPQCVRLTGEQPMLPAHSEPRTRPSLRPQPLSQTLACLRRHCWATAQAQPVLKTHSRK